MPLPSPPFHQISLPDVAGAGEEVARGEVLDAHVVGLPHHDAVAADGLAVRADGAEVLVAPGSALHAGEPGLVPSTITVERFMPRRWMSEVVISTPPMSPSPGSVGGSGLVGGLVVVAGGDQDPVAGLGRVDRRLDGRVARRRARGRSRPEQRPCPGLGAADAGEELDEAAAGGHAGRPASTTMTVRRGAADSEPIDTGRGGDRPALARSSASSVAPSPDTPRSPATVAGGVPTGRPSGRRSDDRRRRANRRPVGPGTARVVGLPFDRS